MAAGRGIVSLGVFEPGHIGAAFENTVIDLYGCAELGIVAREWQASTLNDLMDSARSLQLPDALPEQVVLPLSSCRMRLPGERWPWSPTGRRPRPCRCHG